jgi:predicted MFS family arabinose efflux permease
MHADNPQVSVGPWSRLVGSVHALTNPAVAAMAAVFLINVASYADRSILVVIQEPIKGDLGLSDFQLGLLAGPAFAVFYGFMGLPIARMAEHRSRRRIIITAVYLWSIMTSLCGISQNFVQLCFYRMGVGAAEAAAPPAMHSLISDYFSRAARGRAMAILALGIPLGLLVGGLVGGLVAAATNWRVAFFAIGVPGLLLGLLAQKVMYEAPRTSDTGVLATERLSVAESIRSLWGIPTYRWLLLAAILSGNASHAISTFSASYFMRAHGMGLAAAGGILLTGRGIAGMFGTVVSGWASDKLDRGHNHNYLMVPGVASLLGAGILWLSFDTASNPIALALFILAAFFANMIMSPAFAAVQNVVDPRTRATAAALFLFCITVPGAAGPVVVGYVSDRAAAASMQLPVQTYLSYCPGGKPKPGVALDIAKQCAPASTTGLRAGMMTGLFMYVVSFFAYLFAVITGRGARGSAGMVADDKKGSRSL